MNSNRCLALARLSLKPVQRPPALVQRQQLTSLPTKVRVFSDIFRDRKTKVAYFTSQFLNNYKLRPYIIQAHTIKEARLSLEGV